MRNSRRSRQRPGSGCARSAVHDADFGHVQGLEAGAAVVSTLGDMLAIFNPETLPNPLRPEGVVWDDAAYASYCSGYFVKICAAVLDASDSKLDQRFDRAPVGGKGKCMFFAESKASGSNPDKEHEMSTGFIASNWNKPCPAGMAWRARVQGTFGEAAAAEHGRAFAGPSEYLAYMRTPNRKGQYPWGTMVEAYALASVTGSVVNVFSLHGDALALCTVFYPQDGPKPGSVPINLLHGKHGKGGVHFDALLPSAGGALGLSASALKTARLAAVGAAIARLEREGQRQLAEEIVAGAAQLEALALASVRAEVACALAEGGRIRHDALEETAEIFVVAQAEGRSAVALLADIPRLRTAVAANFAPLPPRRGSPQGAAGSAAASSAAAGGGMRPRHSRNLQAPPPLPPTCPTPLRAHYRFAHTTRPTPCTCIRTIIRSHRRLCSPSADRQARPAGPRSAPLVVQPGPTACLGGIDAGAGHCGADNGRYRPLASSSP